MVPDEGVIVTQGALAVAIHVRSLDRSFERPTVCGDGSVPPLVAENVRALGLTCNAHNGFAKPRSIANVNAVPPSILDIVCRIGAVRRLLTVLRDVLSDMKPPSLVSAHREVRPRWLGRYGAMPVPKKTSMARQVNALRDMV
jgi:hypothetical protein